jgi:hypothetical protein
MSLEQGRSKVNQWKNRIQLAKQITGTVPEPMELLCRKQASAQRKPMTVGAREREIARRQKRPSRERETETQPVSGKSAGKNKSLGTLEQEKSQARKSNAAHYETNLAGD